MVTFIESNIYRKLTLAIRDGEGSMVTVMTCDYLGRLTISKPLESLPAVNLIHNLVWEKNHDITFSYDFLKYTYLIFLPL